MRFSEALACWIPLDETGKISCIPTLNTSVIKSTYSIWASRAISESGTSTLHTPAAYPPHSVTVGAFSRMATNRPGMVLQDDSDAFAGNTVRWICAGRQRGLVAKRHGCERLEQLRSCQRVPSDCRMAISASLLFPTETTKKLLEFARNQSLRGWSPGRCATLLYKTRPLLTSGC